ELGPIVFDRVYPLYALSDIRGSSTQRSLAIQADLLTQLRLARDVIRWAHDARPLPGLHELLYRLDKHAAKIQTHLNSGDEVSIIAFLRADVEAKFDHLQTFGPGVRERIEAYRASLDPRIGTVYDRRRLFEESVTRIADGISSYLDLEDQTAQTMFPHYFEKQKTDGVDHQIYVGGSLLEDGKFEPLYLKSLRLWQLMVTCGVALRVNRLKEKLPVPLEVTHLVLVQHAPLSICQTRASSAASATPTCSPPPAARPATARRPRAQPRGFIPSRVNPSARNASISAAEKPRPPRIWRVSEPNGGVTGAETKPWP